MAAHVAVHTANSKALRGVSLIIAHMFNDHIFFCSLQRPSGVINRFVNMKYNCLIVEHSRRLFLI